MSRETLAELKRREAVYTKEGLCLHCGAEPELGKKRCWYHLNYLRNYRKEIRKTRKSQGLCYECPAKNLQKSFRNNLCKEHFERWRVRLLVVNERDKTERRLAKDES